MNRKLRCFFLDEAHKLAKIRTFSAKVSSKQPKWSYWHNPGREPLRAITFGNLLEETVDRFGDAEAVVSRFQNKRLTFHQAKAKIDQLAAGFIALGLKPGDRVGLMEPNTEEWYISFLAGAKAGLIMLSLNPANSKSDTAHCLRLTQARALIVKDNFRTQNYYEQIVSLMPEIARSPSGCPVQVKDFPEFSHLILTSNQSLPGSYLLEDIYSLANKESLDQLNRLAGKIQPDDACNIQFTSGTTGKPKAALLSHFSMLNNSYNIGKRFSYDKKRHRLCCAVPFFHIYGTAAALLCGLHFGTTIVIPSPSYSSEQTLKSIVEEQCSVLYGTPTMHIDTVSMVEKNTEISSKVDLELVVTAGSLLLPQVHDKIKKTFPSASLCSIYGMTETSPSSFQNLPTDSDNKRKHTVGFVQDHVEVKVVDRAGKMVPFGTPGELLCRGYINMLGYFNQDSRTTELIGRDRWLKTGDEVVLSESGYVQIVGRIKDMIIRGGENIYPKEIEDFLSTHQDIFEVQVFGVPDERMGEVVGAAIIVNPGKSLTENEVKEFCKGNISHFKIPKYVMFTTEFPKTGSGKIQKHILKDRLEKILQENKDLK